MSRFLIYLPSNCNDYPDNRIGEYRTSLPTTLSLDENWEVGLAEISYTFSWFNVMKDQKIDIVDSKGASYLKKGIIVRKGRYTDVDSLVSSIVKLMEQEKGNEIQKLPVMEVDHISKCLIVSKGLSTAKISLFLVMENDLAEMLGVNQENFFDGKYSVTSTKAAERLITGRNDPDHNFAFDMNSGIHSLFVYTNIVNHSIVGNSYSRILRIVQIPPNVKFGDTVVKNYDKPFFFPLCLYDINSIQITIKDDAGEIIPFEFGRVVPALIFQRNE